MSGAWPHIATLDEYRARLKSFGFLKKRANQDKSIHIGECQGDGRWREFRLSLTHARANRR